MVSSFKIALTWRLASPTMFAGLEEIVHFSKLRPEAILMTITFPTVVSLMGAIAFFNFAVKLRHLKSERNHLHSVPTSHSEERQPKVQIERLIGFVAGWFMLAGAFLGMAFEIKLRGYRLVT